MEDRRSACAYERCGRVKKKSNWLGRWRDHFMTIGDGVVRFYSEDKASSSATPPEFGFSVLRRETMLFPISRIESTWEASWDRFYLPHCFVILLRKEGSSGWQLGIQAPDSESQRLWVESLTLARSVMTVTPQLTPSKSDSSLIIPKLLLPSHQPAQRLLADDVGARLGGRAAAPSLLGAKAESIGDEVRAYSRVQGEESMEIQTSHFHGRPHIQQIDPSVNLDKTVFASMLSSSCGTSHASSFRGSRSVGSSDSSESNKERSDASDHSSDSSENSDAVERSRETFSTQELSTEMMPKHQMRENSCKNKKVIFDDHTARNLDILLKSLNISAEVLAAALDNMDFSTAISVEELERIRESIPPIDQLRRLFSFNGDLSELRSVEQDIMKIVRVDRFDARLRIMSFEKSIRIRHERVMDQAKCVRVACEQMSDSRSLHDILQAILRVFNFVNHGVETVGQCKVRGWDMTSAAEVAEFKVSECFSLKAKRIEYAISKVNFTGLHFAVSRLLIRKPMASFTDFSAELALISEAARLNLRTITADALLLSQEAQCLEKDIKCSLERYEAIESSARQQDPIKPLCTLDQIDERSVGPALSLGAIAQRPRSRSGDCAPKSNRLSPVREDIIASQDMHHYPDIFVVGSPRCDFKLVLRKHIASVARHLGIAPRMPLGAFWLQEVQGSFDCLGGLRRTWRRVVLAHHILEVHHSMRVKVVAMPGAIITPFSSRAASPVSRALYAECPYGFEIVTPQKPPAVFRFQCPSSSILEHWLRVLRAEASVAGCGWLEIASPKRNEAADLRRMTWSWKWVTLKGRGELHLYENPRLARECPERPASVLQIAEQHLVGFVNRSSIPDEVKAHGRNWLFNVVDSYWEHHYCSAPSADALEKWCKIIRYSSLGLSTPRQPKELLDQCAEPKRSDLSVSASAPLKLVGAISRVNDAEEKAAINEPHTKDMPERRKVVAVPRLDFRRVCTNVTPRKVVVRGTVTPYSSEASDSESSVGEADEPSGIIGSPNPVSPKVSVLTPAERVTQLVDTVKEEALAAEKVTRQALNEACQQAQHTMHEFGQGTSLGLDANGQPEDIGEFAECLQRFLLTVDNLLQRVGSAWRDIELERSARRRASLCDLPMRTPREWSKSVAQTFCSACGVQTPRRLTDGMSTIASLTPSTREDSFRTPRVDSEWWMTPRVHSEWWMTARGNCSESDSGSEGVSG